MVLDSAPEQVAAPRMESAARDVDMQRDGEKDIAIDLVGEHAREFDAEVEARVLRKIDWFLIPAMVVGMLYLHLIPLVMVQDVNMLTTRQATD